MSPPAAHADAAPPKGLIPLCPAEDLMYRLHEQFAGDSQGASVMRLRGCIEEAPLRAALARLQQRHPKMRTRIVMDGTGRRCFDVLEQPPPVPMEIKDYDSGALPWREEADRMIRWKLDLSTGVDVRVLVLRNRAQNCCELIFAAHHALADGISVLRLTCEVLARYEEVERGGPLPPVESLPLVSVARANTSASPGKRLPMMLKILRKRIAMRRGDWMSLPKGDGKEAQPLFNRCEFSVEETDALTKRCRQEKATAHGAIFAAAVCALREVTTGQELHFRCRSPINIRSMLTGPAGKVRDHDVGCFISGYDNAYTVKAPPDFWTLARQARKELKEFVAQGGPAILYNMVGLARRAKFRKMPKRDTLAINYAGDFGSCDRYGSLVPEVTTFVVKSDTLGPSLAIIGMETCGRLTMNISAAGVPEEFWRRFQDAVLKHIRRAIGGAAT